MPKRRRNIIAGIPQLEVGETYDACAAVVPDRIENPDGPAQARQNTADRVTVQCGTARTSDVWWTTHYAAEGRRRYAEVCTAVGIDPKPELLEALTDPRSMLVLAWCIRRGGAQ